MRSHDSSTRNCQCGSTLTPASNCCSILWAMHDGCASKNRLRLKKKRTGRSSTAFEAVQCGAKIGEEKFEKHPYEKIRDTCTPNLIQTRLPTIKTIKLSYWMICPLIGRDSVGAKKMPPALASTKKHARRCEEAPRQKNPKLEIDIRTLVFWSS